MVQQQAIRDHDQAMTGFFNGTYGKPLAVIAGRRRGPLPFDEHPAQDLARGRLRDRVDDLDGAQLLVRATRSATNAVTSSAVIGPLGDDERLRHLAGLLVGERDHGGVGDRRVGEQQRLQLGGRRPGSPCT